MKKKAICLMIACLSLFAYPELKAGTAATSNQNTEVVIPPHLTPAMEKKVNEFKKHHPDIFKKEKAADTSSAEGMKRDGGVLIISGGALLIIIILLILLL